MSPSDRKLVAVIGATGQQGGGVVRALQASGQFKVCALTLANLATSSPEHSYTPMKQAMASICPSSVIF